ncbi:MAG: hypothetical protein ABFS18_03515 [Thermodesulfobacteriota bacterium]
MKKTVAVFAVIICSFFTWTVRAEAKGALPADAAVLLEMEGQSYYLAHNLHGDRAQRKVYSANYQLSGGLIPWGSKIQIIKIQRNYLSFRDENTGLTWNYWFSGRTRRAVTLKDHLARVFVKDIELLRGQVAGLSELDQDGIYEGRALVGMSRAGVLIANGYPPEFANSKDLMTAHDWHYWLSRFNKIKLSFNRQGYIARIID